MKLIRQADGSLALEQEQDANLRKQAIEKGQPLPTTAMGAADLTGSADVAKMMGTQNQKTAALDEAVAGPQDQLTTAQRQRTNRQQASTQEQASGFLANRLQRLQSTQQNIQTAVDTRKATVAGQAAPTQLQLDETSIANYTEAQQTSIRNYFTGPSEANLQAMAQAFQNVVDPTAFAMQHSTAIGQAAGTAFGNEMPTMAELNMVDSQLASDLGVDEAALSGMRLEDVQARMRAIEAEEFSRVEALRAEFLSASPDRRQQINQELKDLGQIGATGVEASVDKLNNQLESADVIRFGGQQYSLAELLSNDAISRAITNAANNPDTLKDLATTEPELAAWIESNLVDLQNLSKDMEASTEDFKATQATWQETVGKSNKSVLEKLVGPFDFLTKDEMEAYQEELADSGVWQAITESDEINKVFMNNPDLIADLKDYTKDDLISARDKSIEIKKDPLLQRFMGADAPEFIVGDDAVKYDELVYIRDSIPNGNWQPIADLIEDGTFGVAEAEIIVTSSKPRTTYEAFLTNLDFQKKLENAEELDEVLTLVFGNMPIEMLTQSLKDGAELAKYGMAPPGWSQLQSLLDVDPKDGAIDDIDQLKERIGSMLKVGSSPSEILTSDLSTMFAKVRDGLQKNAAVVVPPTVKHVRSTMEDGDISLEELDNIYSSAVNPKDRDAILKILKTHYPKQYHKAMTAKTDRDGTKTITDTIIKNTSLLELVTVGENGKIGYRPETLTGPTANLEKLQKTIQSLEEYFRTLPGHQSGEMAQRRAELAKVSGELKKVLDKRNNAYNAEMAAWNAVVSAAKAKLANESSKIASQVADIERAIADMRREKSAADRNGLGNSLSQDIQMKINKAYQRIRGIKAQIPALEKAVKDAENRPKPERK